jgi:hypothetical protein
MIIDPVARFVAYPSQECRQVASLKLDGRAASAADQVMAVAVIGGGIAVTAIVSVDPPYKPHLDQDVQRAVHRHEAHRGEVQSGPLVHLSWASVAIILQEGFDHRSPWLSDPVTFPAKLLDYDPF